MKFYTLTAVVLGCSCVLTPALALAADVTADQVTSHLATEPTPPSSMPLPPPMPPMGGGSDNGANFYPIPYGGGISVDATITKEVTPDYIGLTASCEVTTPASRADVRAELQKLYQEIKAAVGKNGKVRRNGGSFVYPYYDQSMGKQTTDFTGTLNILIRISTPSAAQDISDLVESKDCSVNWDVRMQDTQTYEFGLLQDLISRLNTRKALFEKILGKKLTRVTAASLSTWVDSYGSYDPEANTVEATTTLTVTFEGSTRTPMPLPMGATGEPMK